MPLKKAVPWEQVPLHPTAVSYTHPAHKRRPFASKVVEAYTEPKSSNLGTGQPQSVITRRHIETLTLALLQLAAAHMLPETLSCDIIHVRKT